MHRRRVALLLITLLAAVAGAATTLITRPAVGQAQASTSAGAARASGRYQLAVLPSSPGEQRQWLVLDTETGTFTHWVELPGHYEAQAGIGVGRTMITAERIPKREPAGARR